MIKLQECKENIFLRRLYCRSVLIAGQLKIVVLFSNFTAGIILVELCLNQQPVSVYILLFVFCR